jgi:hypothetical protein
VHEGETPEELAAYAATMPARSLANVAAEVPDVIRAVIDRALSFERAGRWETARAMREALARAYELATGCAVPAPPQGGVPKEEPSILPIVMQRPPIELEPVRQGADRTAFRGSSRMAGPSTAMGSLVPGPIWSGARNTPVGPLGAGLFDSLSAKYRGRRSDITELFEQIRHTPPTCEANGMHATNLIELLRSHDVVPPSELSPKRHRFFPMREHMQLLVLAAVSLYPDQPAGEGLRRLGWTVIPTYARSPAGSGMMKLACNWETTLRMLAAGYHVGQRPGTARVTSARRGYARLELRQIWSFGETYHRGVVEGLLRWCKIECSTRAHKLSRSNTDIDIVWRED